MSIPRHFSQRPRRKMAPPPNSMQAHHVVETPVAETPVEVVEAPTPAPVVVEAPAPEPEPEVKAAAAPAWNASMKKAELLKFAHDLGLAVTEADTKAVILTALDGTLAGQ